MGSEWMREKHDRADRLCHGAKMHGLHESEERRWQMAALLPDALAEIDRLQAEVRRLTESAGTVDSGALPVPKDGEG